MSCSIIIKRKKGKKEEEKVKGGRNKNSSHLDMWHLK